MTREKYTINGIHGTFKYICEQLGIVAYTTAIRRKNLGWTVEDALTKPPQEQNSVERGDKICSCCKERKPISDYYTLSRRKGTELMPYCKVCCSNKTKQDSKEIRAKVLAVYSNGELKCSHCGEDRYDVLDLDHIEGNGNQERKEFKTSRRLFKNLIDNNFPSGYRVLCRNCNWIAYINLKDKTP